MTEHFGAHAPARPARLVRRAESAHLLRELSLSGRRRAKIVELPGDPGSGKTRLLAELTAEAERRNLPAAVGRCSELETQVAYHAFTALFGDLPTGEAQDGPGRLPAAHAALRPRIEQASADGLLVVIDDFHWADESSVRFVDHLVRWPCPTPLLLVIAHRPRQSSQLLRSVFAHGAEAGIVDKVTLAPLTIDQTARLLDCSRYAEQVERLYRKSGGNPLYLRALEPTLDTDPIPPLLAAKVQGETANLGRAEGELLDVAAVLGNTFDVETLAEVACVPARHASLAAQRLAERDLVRRTGEGRFTFRHAAVRASLREAVLPDLRAQVHRRALAALAAGGAPAAVLAEHVLGAPGRPSPAEVDILLAAVREALPGRPRAAVRWSRQTRLGLPADPDPRRTELLSLEARALALLGRVHESRGLLEEIGRTVQDDGSADMYGPAADALAKAELFLGKYDQPHRAAPEGPDPDRGHDAVTEADLRFFARLVYAATDAPARPGPPDAPRRGPGPGAPSADADLAQWCRSLDLVPEERLREQPEKLAIAGWAELAVGQLDRAAKRFEQGLVYAARLGHGYLRPTLLCGVSIVARITGRLAEALSAAREAREAARRGTADGMYGFAFALESLAAGWANPPGDPAAAELAREAAAALGPDSVFSGVALLAQAHAARLAGEPVRCVDLLTGHRDATALPFPAAAERAATFELLAAACADAGLDPQPWARAADELARRGGGVPAAAFALAALGHVARRAERFEEAAELYVSAAQGMARGGAMLHQARMLAEAAHCAPDEVVARRLLAAAQRSGRECGAERIVAEAEPRRPRIPGRPRPPAESGALDVLTEREREIADMAGSGRRTKQIAADLSISPRTVEVHLTSIYRKLEVSSRTALTLLVATNAPAAPEPGPRRRPAPVRPAGRLT